MSQNTQFFPHIFVMDGTVYYLSRTDKSRYKRREKCLDFFFGSYFPSEKERKIVGGSGVERDGCGKMRFENIYSFISGISWIRFHVFDTTFKYIVTSTEMFCCTGNSWFCPRQMAHGWTKETQRRKNNINFPKYVFDFVIISSKDRRRCLCVA